MDNGIRIIRFIPSAKGRDMAITTDAQVKAAKLPAGKNSIKLTVGGGLYLLINKSGKYWRYSYRYNGKRKDYSIGAYPAVSLKQAKLDVVAPKALLKDGIDPNAEKARIREANRAAEHKKKAQALDDSHTFEAVGREWFETIQTGWADSHAIKQANRLKNHLYPALGNVPVKQLTRQQITDTLKAIHSPDVARRTSQLCYGILNYALNRGYLEAMPMGSLKGVLPDVESKKMPVITDKKQLGAFLRACWAYEATYPVQMALKILPYLAVRGGEFRQAEWTEFNLDEGIWTIPASHRKLKLIKKRDAANTHIVPLSKQVVELLQQLHQYTGKGRHVFPSARGDSRPMSDGAINAAYAGIGFKGLMVAHSWRSVFSTAMNEQGFNPDAIEAQLAHTVKGVRGKYNRGQYMADRVQIMRQYANYLDSLRTGADVIPFGCRA